MKVWITGAGGMMGSHLAEMLLAAGHDVYATYCRPTIDPSDLQFNGAEVDITDWCSVYDSIATFRPDAVFHLAAQSYPAVSWARPVETLTTNMVGTAIDWLGRHPDSEPLLSIVVGDSLSDLELAHNVAAAAGACASVQIGGASSGGVADASFDSLWEFAVAVGHARGERG